MSSLAALLQRFWSKVRKTTHPDPLKDHWYWTGGRSSTRKGKVYGAFNITSKRWIYAHRFSYWLAYGTLDKKLVIDHKCRTPMCVNPKHLELVPSRINTLRGVGPSAKNARKTHCPRGHEFTPENTYVKTDYRSGRQYRSCKPCMISRARAQAASFRGRLRKGTPTEKELRRLLYRGKERQEIARIYGVTPTAVRRWIKKYKLEV